MHVVCKFIDHLSSTAGDGDSDGDGGGLVVRAPKSRADMEKGHVNASVGWTNGSTRNGSDMMKLLG